MLGLFGTSRGSVGFSKSVRIIESILKIKFSFMPPELISMAKQLLNMPFAQLEEFILSLLKRG